MKRYVLIVALCVVSRAATGDSWQLQQIFTNRSFGTIAFNGDQYLCLEGMQVAGASTNLTDWTEASLVIDPSLFEVDPGDGVWLDLLHLAALPSGQYLAVLLKTEYPQMGNVYFRTIRSVLSSDGITWGAPVLVHWLVGTLASSHYAQAGGLPLLVAGDYPEGWILGDPYSTCHFFTYSATSNIWTQIFQTETTSSSQALFSDGEYFYFTYRKHLESWASTTQAMLVATDGASWTQIGSEYVPAADCHAGQIFGASHVFTSGRQWEPSTNYALSAVKYNGNRIVGFQSDALVVSDDFGKTWQRTIVGEYTPVRIIEAQGMYVALIQTPVHPEDPINYPTTWNSSIYTINSRPTRTHVSAISPLLLTNDALHLQTETNGVYQIECVSDLRNSDWLPYGLPIAGDGQFSQIPMDTTLATGMFFRTRAANIQ